MHGFTSAAIASWLLGRHASAREIQATAARKEALYRRLCVEQGDGFALSPGAAVLLDALARAATPRTIATSSGGENVDFFFERLGLGRWFDRACVVEEDGTFAGKPAPDVYLRAAAALALPPASCLAVEDSHAGLRAAVAAGIGVVVALGSERDGAALREIPGVARVIGTLDELLPGLPTNA